MESQTQVASRGDPVPLGIGQREFFGPDPRTAFALALLVALLVFGILWKLRKTFGMRE